MGETERDCTADWEMGATRAWGLLRCGARGVAGAPRRRRGWCREFPAWQACRRSRAPLRGIALAIVGVAQPCARGQARGVGVGATGAGRCRTRASVRGASGGRWAVSGFDGVGGDRGARGDGAPGRRYRGAADRAGRVGAAGASMNVAGTAVVVVATRPVDFRKGHVSMSLTGSAQRSFWDSYRQLDSLLLSARLRNNRRWIKMRGAPAFAAAELEHNVPARDLGWTRRPMVRLDILHHTVVGRWKCLRSK